MFAHESVDEGRMFAHDPCTFARHLITKFVAHVHVVRVYIIHTYVLVIFAILQLIP